MATVLQLKQELGSLYDQAKAIFDKAESENRGFNSAEETQYQSFLLRMEAKRKEIQLQEQAEGFTGISKPMGSNQHSSAYRSSTADNIEAIFCRHIRTGDPAAEAEIRAYNNTDANEGTPADGGYTVPVGMVRDIVARRDEMMLAHKLGVTDVPGKGLSVDYPIDAENDVLFTSVAEAGSINQDWPALNKKTFTLVKYAKVLTLSWELLRDEDAQLMKFINNWTARGWAGTHNSLLVTEVLANATAALTLASPTAIAASEIPSLVGKVAPEYRDGSQWLMHQNTFSYLQSLASSSVFTFSPTPGGDPNGNLWGYPVNQSSYMTAYAASVKSLVYGNFAYLGMREGQGLTMLRDPYSAAGTGQVKLWFWFDAVYGVLQAEALAFATHPSA